MSAAKHGLEVKCGMIPSFGDRLWLTEAAAGFAVSASTPFFGMRGALPDISVAEFRGKPAHWPVHALEREMAAS
jgi:hypothetical protein